jgi:hypothetical protein
MKIEKEWKHVYRSGKTFALQKQKAREAEPPGPWIFSVPLALYQDVIASRMSRPVPEGLVGSPQQQQQQHMQVC